MDKGVHRDRGVASIGRATGFTMGMGPPDIGMTLRGMKTSRGSRALKFVCIILAGVVRDNPTAAFSATG
jgi:hypothetical protein